MSDSPTSAEIFEQIRRINGEKAIDDRFRLDAENTDPIERATRAEAYRDHYAALAQLWGQLQDAATALDGTPEWAMVAAGYLSAYYDQLQKDWTQHARIWHKQHADEARRVSE